MLEHPCSPACLHHVTNPEYTSDVIGIDLQYEEEPQYPENSSKDQDLLMKNNERDDQLYVSHPKD